MKKHGLRLLMLGGVLAGVAACAPPRTQTADFAAAIIAGDEKFVALFGKGDSEGIAQMYTADAMIMPAGSDAITGAAAIAQFFQEGFAAGVRNIKLTSNTIDGAGDLALETGTYELTDANGGHVDHGKFLVSWKRDNGTWKIYRDIWTTSVPPPAVAKPAGPPGSGEGAAIPFGS